MKLPLTTLLALTLVTPAFAALPPHYQRQAEFAAVLAVAVDALGIANPIEAIEMVAPDRFEVRAGKCTLGVDIVDKPAPQEPGWVGPRQFEAVAGEPACQ